MPSAALQYAEQVVRQDEILDDLEQAAHDQTSLHAALTLSDRRRIDELLLYRGGTRLDSLLKSWESCARALERDDGRLMYEEYENWLNVRDGLEDAVSMLSPAGRQILEARLAPLDDRVVQATLALSTSIRPLTPWRPQGWCWYRVPRSFGESFRKRLKHIAPAAAEEASRTVDDGSEAAQQ